jgi:hypothetical protein
MIITIVQHAGTLILISEQTLSFPKVDLAKSGTKRTQLSDIGHAANILACRLAVRSRTFVVRARCDVAASQHSRALST